MKHLNLFTFFVVFCSTVSAQTAGTGIVIGAAITLQDTATGIARSATTNGAGSIRSSACSPARIR